MMSINQQIIVKSAACALLFSVAALLLPSCASVKKAGGNAVASMLSGTDKKGRSLEKKAGSSDVMTVLTGENDPVLVAEFFPTALKMYELMQASVPDHLGLAVMTGSMNVMYANAFVQAPAERLTDADYDKKYAELKRAKLHYLRGRDYVLGAFEKRFPGFSVAFLSDDDEMFAPYLARLTSRDVNAAYWCAAGALGAFSLDPLDAALLGALRGPVALLERAAALDPAYSNGALWLVLATFYNAAPGDFGGNKERSVYCYEQALKASGGASASVYLTYAESFCVPVNDRAGFEKALSQALAINPDENPANRLMTLLSQEKARYLLENIDTYFFEW